MILLARKFILAWLLSALMAFALVGGAHAYSSVLAFGDSLSDNGDADGYGAVVSTNGAVWVEYLADHYGAGLLDMAYSGATTSMDNPAVSQHYLDLYNTYADPTYLAYSQYFAGNTGLQWQAGAYAANYGTIADNTLVTISAGGNDMFNGRSAVDAADNIYGVLMSLIDMGGDAFMVMNLATSQQNDAYAAWMEAFNAKLAANLAALCVLNPDVDLMLVDMNQFTAEVDNFTGTWLANSCDSPYADPENCSDGVFAWYDTVGVHPTTQVHQQIAEYAAGAAPVPEPATMVLLFTGLAGLIGIRRKK